MNHLDWVRRFLSSTNRGQPLMFALLSQDEIERKSSIIPAQQGQTPFPLVRDAIFESPATGIVNQLRDKESENRGF